MKFLSDKPPREDELETHKPIAASLLKHLQAKHSGSIVIGLFGDWGTGKSSIIYWLKGFIEQSKFPVAYAEMDAWKTGEAYFGVSFVRSLAYNCLVGKDQKAVLRKISTKRTREKSYAYREGAVLLSVLLLSLAVLLSILTVYLYLSVPNVPWINIATFVFTALVVVFVQIYLSEFAIKTDTKELDVSYEQANHFQNILISDILPKIKSEVCCVVVDNIDRLEPDEAFAVIRKLKAFIIDEEKLNKLGHTKFVIIVPADDRLLIHHIEEIYKTEEQNAGREFLKKFFNITVRIPPPIRTDLFPFTRACLEEAYDETRKPDSIDDIAFILNRAANRNPRDVKSLINEFVSLNLLLETAPEGPIIDRLKDNPQLLAFFVGLTFISDYEQLPDSSDQLISDFMPIVISESPISFGPKRDFLSATRSYWTALDKELWFWLVHHKTSRIRSEFNDFDEIYKAAVDRDEQACWELMKAHEGPKISEIVRDLYIEAPGNDATLLNITLTAVSFLAKGLDPSLLPTEVVNKINYFFGKEDYKERFSLINRAANKLTPRFTKATIEQMIKDISSHQASITTSENVDYSEEENNWIDFLVSYEHYHSSNPQTPKIAPAIIGNGIPFSSELARLLVDSPACITKETIIPLANRFSRDEKFLAENEVIGFVQSLGENGDVFAGNFLKTFSNKIATIPTKVEGTSLIVLFHLLQSEKILEVPKVANYLDRVLDALASFIPSRDKPSEKLSAYMSLLMLMGDKFAPTLSAKAKSIQQQLGNNIFGQFNPDELCPALKDYPALFHHLSVAHNVEIAKLNDTLFETLMAESIEKRIETIKELLLSGSTEKIKIWIKGNRPSSIKFDVLSAFTQIFEEKNFDLENYKWLDGFNFGRNKNEFKDLVHAHYAKAINNVDLKTAAGISKLTEIISRFAVVPSPEQIEQIESTLKTLNLEGFQGEVKALREACSGKFLRW